MFAKYNLLPLFPLTSAQICVAHEASAPTIAKAEIPVDLSTGRFRIDAQVNGGTPVKIAFDTGSQGMVVPRSLVEKYKLPLVGETLMGSPFGGEPVKVDVVRLDSLTVGGVASTVLDAIVMEDNAMSGLEPMIIIGGAQFPNKVIGIDFARLLLTLSDSAPDGKGKWQKLDERGLPAGSISYAGKSFPLHIDSGNPGLLNLPAAMAPLLRVKEPMVEIGQIRTVDRTIPLKAGKVNAKVGISGLSVRLGTVTFADIPSANIGLKGLKSFRMVIDNPRRRWRLEQVGATTVVLTMPPFSKQAG